MSFVISERNRSVEAGVILHPQLEGSALRYFRNHDIAWWGGAGAPPDSPISSQVACVNHLEPARLDRSIALAVARSVVPDAEVVVAVEDGGFVGYEWIGEANYLGERSHTRGANATSLDALMAVEADGQIELLLIEWKYTESYKAGNSRAFSSQGTDRVAIYRSLLEREDCPIQTPSGDVRALFYDPIEQLMRQTLLGWQMVDAGELGAADWHHVVVVPEGNAELLDSNPSPDLPGDSLREVWECVLTQPSRFSILSPTELLGQVTVPELWREWREWLNERYGS